MNAGFVTLSAMIRQGDEQLDSGAAIEYDAESLVEVTCRQFGCLDHQDHGRALKATNRSRS